MKRKLMIQSLSPLALLTMVRNFSFVMNSSDGTPLTTEQFLQINKVLLIVMFACLVWLIYAIWCWICFASFKFSDKKSGYTVKNVCEDEEASLEFYMTLIIPLLVSDVNTSQGALTLVLLVVMMYILLKKTSRFYANPVLALLGYRVYHFEFEDNKRYLGNVLVYHDGRLVRASVSSTKKLQTEFFT